MQDDVEKGCEPLQKRKVYVLSGNKRAHAYTRHIANFLKDTLNGYAEVSFLGKSGKIEKESFVLIVDIGGSIDDDVRILSERAEGRIYYSSKGDAVNMPDILRVKGRD